MRLIRVTVVVSSLAVFGCAGEVVEPDRSRSPLALAVEAGDADVVRRLAEAGAWLDAPDAAHVTALKLAAGRGDAAMVRLLLDLGASLTTPADRRDPTGTALHRAVWRDHRGVAALLLDRGAPVDVDNAFGEHPLHFAARRNNVALARLLLDRGADPSGEADRQATPLHGAAYNGAAEVIALLVERGADVHRPEALGATPLFIAAEQKQPRAIRALLRAGAGVGGQIADGRSILHAAASLAGADRTKHTPDDPEHGTTPLADAALATVRLLLDVGADPNAQVPHGWRVLEAAATEGTPAVVALLLKRGADPNKRGARGRVALHHAADRGDIAMIRTLIAGGANVNLADADGLTPMREALWHDPPHRAAAQELAVHGAAITLNTAVIIGVDMTRSMLASDRRALARLRGGRTNTLLIAAARAEPEVLTLLLAEGARVGFVNPAGWTALHAAIAEGRLANARLLLEYGADPNRITGQGDHPIDLARRLRRTDLVDLLVAYGAKTTPNPDPSGPPVGVDPP